MTTKTLPKIHPGMTPVTERVYPTPDEVIALRREVQQALNLPMRVPRPGQSICGMAVHYEYTSWCRWESGKTKMHPAVWELANLKMRPWIAGEPVTDEHLLTWIEHFKGEHRGSNPNSHTAK